MTIGTCVSELLEVSGKGGSSFTHSTAFFEHLTLLTVLLICQQQMALLLQIARKLVYCKIERPGGRRREGEGEEKLPIYKTQCSLKTRLASTASSQHRGWEGNLMVSNTKDVRVLNLTSSHRAGLCDP